MTGVNGRPADVCTVGSDHRCASARRPSRPSDWESGAREHGRDSASVSGGREQADGSQDGRQNDEDTAQQDRRPEGAEHFDASAERGAV